MQSNRSGNELNSEQVKPNEERKDKSLRLTPFFFMGSYLITHGFMSAVGLTLFLYILLRFLHELEYRFPMDTIIALIATLQWVVGPILAYSGYNTHYKYHMYVTEDTYMYLAVPGCLLLWVGLRLCQHKYEHEQQIIQQSILFLKGVPVKYAYWLIVVGLIAPFLGQALPATLGFVAYLMGVFKYIGLLFFLFSNQTKHKWWVLGGIYLVTVLAALKSAMFHDLILWSLFLGIYLVYYLKVSFKNRILLLVIGFFAIFIIQLVKAQFRDVVWGSGTKESEVTLYTDLVSNQLSAGDIFRHSVVESFVYRINQGWIISRIMENVPSQVAYAGGETVEVAIKDALVPRFLNPTKKEAGGQENYTRFTGYTLTETSMGISILGEGYANYGVTGAWFFLFIVGVFFSFVLRKTIDAAQKYPSLILFLPLIYLQVVKAETEFYVVLNYLIKSLVMVAFFIWFARKKMNWNI
jgi:hypothetical protein